MNATNDDIRRLLRSFGIRADEAIQARARDARGVKALRLRIVVEDLTAYPDAQPAKPPLLLEVEGEVAV
ncbi:MAG TPA: hypothetical protein VNN10_03295 [Dehalococcoidia bacterium]|nr:hypothetical protein [Dehalococcoidia bacterium]